jgi:uncharacterized protein
VLPKLEQLQSLLRGCGRTLVAYSGGVDSAFLAKAAGDVLGKDALAVIADTPSLPRRELDEALELGRRFGFAVRVVPTDELNNPDYTSNPANRCYFCKSELFDKLAVLAKAEGWQTIVYGENADDAGDFRPGAQAAREFQVRAPLKEVHLTKAEIRALSAELGLPTADKPAMACLSSRIPYGEPVTAEALAMIESAENILRDLGFHDVRVRHHTMGNPKSEAESARHAEQIRNPKSLLARIEVGPAELGRFFANGLRDEVIDALRRIGYTYVTVDLAGYRRGSSNETLTNLKPHKKEQS